MARLSHWRCRSNPALMAAGAHAQVPRREASITRTTKLQLQRNEMQPHLNARYGAAAYLSRKARLNWSVTGLTRYERAVRSPVVMKTSTGMPGTSLSNPRWSSLIRTRAA